jgi:hypothetical protein
MRKLESESILPHAVHAHVDTGGFQLRQPDLVVARNNSTGTMICIYQFKVSYSRNPRLAHLESIIRE